MEKYYYKHDGYWCLEECPIGLKTPFGGNFTILIGGGFCQECRNYKGGSKTEHYVICKHLQPKRKTNWKKILLRIAAIILWLFIILVLNILSVKNKFLHNFLSGAMVGIIAYVAAIYIWNLSNKLK